MKTYTNEKLIQQRTKLVRWTSMVGLAVLGAGLVASFSEEYYFWSVPALIVGFLLANISAYNANRYVKEPRADQALEKALRGFDNTYQLFNYTGPVNHVLLGPSGLYIFTIKNQDGAIYREGRRWRRDFSWRRILFFFNEEMLGNPAREAIVQVNQLLKRLNQTLDEEQIPPIEPVIVFTHPEAKLYGTDNTDESQGEVPAMLAKDLKKFLRGRPKGSTIDSDTAQQVAEILKG
jgi:hypothetical protein